MEQDICLSCDSLIRSYYFKFVPVLPGGPAGFLRVPVSDLLPHRPTISRLPESGAAAVDVWPASNHLLQVSSLLTEHMHVGFVSINCFYLTLICFYINEASDLTALCFIYIYDSQLSTDQILAEFFEAIFSIG